MVNLYFVHSDYAVCSQSLFSLPGKLKISITVNLLKLRGNYKVPSTEEMGQWSDFSFVVQT